MILPLADTHCKCLNVNNNKKNYINSNTFK